MPVRSAKNYWEGVCEMARIFKSRNCRKLFAAALFLLGFCLIAGFAAPALSSSGGEGDHHAEPKGWVATDTYRVMNFAVLAVVLFLLLRKPVSNALNNRIEDIRVQLEELEKKKQEAQAELARYDKQLKELDAQSEKIVEDYIRQGEEAKARILEEAEKSADKLEEQAKRNIDFEIKQAKLHLMEEVMDKALLKAEEILRDRITHDDQDRLVDEYLQKVVAK